MTEATNTVDLLEKREAVTVEDPGNRRDVDSSTKRRLPWFGVGTDLHGVTSAEEAIERAGLNWEVELRQSGFKTASGNWRVAPDRFHVVRKDLEKPLGNVGTAYVPFQNREAFSFADPLVDAGLAEYWSAGDLRDDRQVFLVMKFTEGFELAGGHEGDLFLMLRTSHDGSKAIQPVVTPIEAFCTNQTALILRTAQLKWSVQHYTTAGAKLEAARKTLEKTREYTDELKKVSEQLAASQLELDDFEAMLKEVLPARPKTQELVTGIRQTLERSQTIRDEFRTTRWGALEAVTEYFDHRRPTRSDEARMLSITDGVGARVRNAVAQRLLAG